MAIAFVQKLGTEVANSTNNATVAMTTANAVAAGALIVGFASQRLSISSATITVSGGGLTWVDDADQGGASGNLSSVHVFHALAPAGLAAGTVITVTFTGSTARKVLGLYEFSGAAAASVVGVTTVNSGGSGNPSVTLSSAAAAGDLVFAAYHHSATGTAGTQTPFAGFTSAGSNVAGTSSWEEGYGQYKIDAVGTADAAGYTPSVDTTTNWAAAAVCFHQAAAAGAGGLPIPRRDSPRHNQTLRR